MQQPLSSQQTPAARAWVRFGVALAMLWALFALPLANLVRLALENDLYSYVLLMPFVCFYLAWINKATLRSLPVASSKGLSLAWGAGGLALVAWAERGHLAMGMGSPGSGEALSLHLIALVALTFGAALFCLGRRVVWEMALPLGMLIFLVPLPPVVEAGVEIFFQKASAETALAFFRIAGIPVVQQGLVLDLPTITLEVAPECSGIRSTLVLFITSLVAGYLFLERGWKRALLTVVVVPIAILRNGFRIFVIGWLCVRVDPSMIHSWVHRKGGPLFFVLSLVPFFALLLLLRKSERMPSSTAVGKGMEPQSGCANDKPVAAD